MMGVSRWVSQATCVSRFRAAAAYANCADIGEGRTVSCAPANSMTVSESADVDPFQKKTCTVAARCVKSK